MEMLTFKASSAAGQTLRQAGWTAARLPSPVFWGNLSVFGTGVDMHFGTAIPEAVFDSPDVAFYAPSGHGANKAGGWERVTDERTTNDGRGVVASQGASGKRFSCQVKYATNAPLHPAWGKFTASAATRKTLLVKACWVDQSHCGKWGLVSTPPHTNGNGECRVAGPRAVAPVPSVRQRKVIYDAIASIPKAKLMGVTFPGLLRLAFHDAGTYSIKAGAMRGGPNGCMRFESVHGAAPNAGLAFGLDTAATDLLRQFINLNQGSAQEVGAIGQWDAISPFSAADLYQFGAIVTVAELSKGRADLTAQFKWGREDAPLLWCQGELQDAMPDFSGGHKSGWHKHGAGKVAERLQTTFDVSREYFEKTLGLTPKEWVALLGAHSVGRVAGLDPGGAKSGLTPFDSTPDTLDNEVGASGASKGGERSE